ncbi:hypothetical protein C3747_4g99 [Trypanosoma cruzi]|uniref:Cytochrome b5 heme-binding domain-containing protein n=2 Tax=Trypanosoma cruzi TaxID=5693 RepID=Q4CLK1_TRYCC|nr:hypothetical protein, conserved [Trypanosoma cruzi]EAN81154.1 hypothetical protein, conserved [Trypanosoma cruzi]PWV20972.1 hypothetical protein C3747_4g99 [Trypanosoma cruzi]RNC37218.1 putative cytochrome b [Trypanosoma cruzi]|eukprot:XP_802600.1 hypothetical protein [Trypanosoma cruzi strain CL Brener]
MDAHNAHVSFADVPCVSGPSSPLQQQPQSPTPQESGADVSPFVNDGTFRIPVTSDIVGSIPRVKVPRQKGCSMRDWSVCLEKQKQALKQRTLKHQREEESDERCLLAKNCGRRMLPRLSMQEVMTHATHDDLWIVIRGVVYDCNKFQYFHPGGEKILRRCAGRDCTALYEYFHPWVSCEGMMAPFAVGVIEDEVHV